MHIPKGHNWVNKKIKNVHMPTGSLALMIKRGKDTIITKGDTEIFAGDDIILSVPPYTPSDNEKLEERRVDRLDEWCNRAICDLDIPDNVLITMIIRDDETVIPDGKTILLENDVVVVMYQ
jgi:cell volume regulation protein A